MNPYKEEIEKKIINILYKSERKLNFGEIKNQLLPKSTTTFSNRLQQLCVNPEITKENKRSRYVIQPVLIKEETKRGNPVYYSLTKDARILCDLKLPILKSESEIEKAYRLLLFYNAFEFPPPLPHSNNKKIMNETEYSKFLEKLHISENDLQLYEKPKLTRNLFNGSTYKSTILFDPQSEIKFRRIDYLEGSDKNGNSEYECTLPGLSINEFVFGIRSGLVYEHIKFKKDEVIQYFKLLKNKNLIEKLISLPLETLDEERYVIVDSTLKKFLQQCWVLYGSVTALYLFQKWRYLLVHQLRKRRHGIST